MKKYKSDSVESIDFYLSETKTPISFKTKLNELIEAGMTEQEARTFILSTPLEMEVYYEKNMGLFMVESEAVDNNTIFDPYTGQELEENEDDSSD